MKSIVHELWSVGDCFRARPKDKKDDPTSCPASRKINMFPGSQWKDG
jgi:hypothetical protein